MGIKHFILYTAILFLMACTSNDDNSNISSNNAIKSNAKLFNLLQPSESGIDFINTIIEDEKNNYYTFQYYYNGGGVGIGDFDGDGFEDVFLTGNRVADKLYFNKGNLTFEDKTAESNINDKVGWSSGVTVTDVNQDGHLDIYVCKGGNYKEPAERRNKLYINKGDGTFREMAKLAGLADEGYSVQAAFFDYDKDGDLDMFLLNHPMRFKISLIEYLDFRKQYNPHFFDKLYQNQGNDTFKDVSQQAGISKYGYGLGLCISDVNKDGWPDIYISNDYTEHDFYHINQGDGTFKESYKDKFNQGVQFGMGCDIADLNNDGWADIGVVDMMSEDFKRSKVLMPSMNVDLFNAYIKEGFHHQYMFNALHLNNGNGTFSNIGKMAGISKTDWSWALLAADYNLDGFNDIAVSNGFLFDVLNQDFAQQRVKDSKNKSLVYEDLVRYKSKKYLQSTPIENYIFQNNGDLTFTNASKEWGFNFKGFSNGMAYADLDNDGDLELVTNNINSEAQIYKNLAVEQNRGNFIKLKPAKNEWAKFNGAKVNVTTTENNYYKELYTTRGFQSSVGFETVFGINNNEEIESIVVELSNGKKYKVNDLAKNKSIELTTVNLTAFSQPAIKTKSFFAEQTNQMGIDFKHQESNYDDFKKEILLPHKFSQLGPALAVADINNDGYEDFYIGGASNQAGAFYLQNKTGNFTKSIPPDFVNHKVFEDTDAIFLDVDSDGDQDLYVCSGSNELEDGTIKYQDRIYLNLGNNEFRMPATLLPEMYSSTGTVAAHDINNDGVVEFFVGGQIVPGQYPKAPKSYFLQMVNNKYEDVSNEIAPDLQNIGLVKDALWADVTGNNEKELIIVGEWMPISIFALKNKKLVNITNEMGLVNSQGWWRSIKAADVNNDGKMDLIAGNIGTNSKFKASEKVPFQVFYDDFDDNGKGDIVLAQQTKNGELHPVRGKECSSEQIPSLAEKFPSFDEFANAELHEILGNQIKESLHLKANTFASKVFINQNNESFKATELPSLAQVAPANDIVIKDFNNDNNLDMILAGNYFQTEAETPRYDAGTGVLLIGDGQGNFKALSPEKSGLSANKDVRKLAIIQNLNLLIVANNNDNVQTFKWDNEQIKLLSKSTK